jgi:hypothetical protein
MVKNQARSIADARFGYLRQQIKYKVDFLFNLDVFKSRSAWL